MDIQEYDRKQKKKNRKWYEQNREKVIAKSKEYYQTNKETIKKRSLENVQCPLCKKHVKRGSLSHHKNNQKCRFQQMFQYGFHMPTQ